MSYGYLCQIEIKLIIIIINRKKSGFLPIGQGVIRASEGRIRAGKKNLMPPQALTNFEIQKINLNVFLQEIIYLK